MGLFPLGEAMAVSFVRKGSLSALLAFAFALGFGTTFAEPALIAIAAEGARAAAAAGTIAAIRGRHRDIRLASFGFGSLSPSASPSSLAFSASSRAGRSTS